MARIVGGKGDMLSETESVKEVNEWCNIWGNRIIKCKFKSPVIIIIIISDGEEIKSSRSEVNSEMKVVLDKDGGR